jgi:hypothetical protein
LRQQILLNSARPRELWELLLRSLPAFTTLFRHALIASGDAAPQTVTSPMRDTVEILAARVKFDPSPFLQLLDIREHKAEQKNFEIGDICGRYLLAVQQVATAVDTMLDSRK